MKIRAFEPEDVAAVASLWQYWFKDKTRTPDPRLVALATRIYVDDPNTDGEIRPLVAVDDAGAMLGFLGTSVTPIVVDGREGKLAGVFPSVVSPDAPTTVAAFLLRKFLAGPQDFTFSDGGHVKFERIWELLGGRIMQLQSLRWVKLLRPGAVGLGAVAGRRASVAALAPVLRPLVGGGDQLARRAMRTRLRAPAGSGDYVTEPLTPQLMASAAPELLGKARLRPRYLEAHVAWQQREMAKIVEQGEFRARLVRNLKGAAVGWYVYYLKAGGVSRVYDVEALPQHLDGVVAELFLEADAGGAGALIGRMEPRLRGVMNRHGALVHNGGSLQMAHARDATLLDDAELGRLAFSRLQGENWYWWAIDSRVVP